MRPRDEVTRLDRESHTHDHYFYASLMIAGALREAAEKGNTRIGFLYVGYSREVRALKFGGSGDCPLCRMKQRYKVGKLTVKLQPLAISFSDDWKINEQKFLAMLGTPKFGLEWFEPEQRVKYLVSNGIVHPLHPLNMKCGGIIASRCG